VVTFLAVTHLSMPAAMMDRGAPSTANRAFHDTVPGESAAGARGRIDTGFRPDTLFAAGQPTQAAAERAMAKDFMNYNGLVQDALRGVVRQALARVARQGLPGNHHLYIAFRTGHAGVDIPVYLRERYPDEMTIVLQHQFWGLVVRETDFEVQLSFNKTPEKLTIPFAALTGFFDPSVQFGLQFQPNATEGAQADGANVPAVNAPKTGEPRAIEPKASKAEAAEAKDTARDTGKDGAEAPKRGEVVTLDAFRRK
jgi:hypothetical protein